MGSDLDTGGKRYHNLSHAHEVAVHFDTDPAVTGVEALCGLNWD